MDPDYRLLRYFVTLAEELHFGHAAERLTIAQPALSHQIKRLETQLGTPLFERRPRSVALTRAGQALLPSARDALRAADHALQVARQAARGERGELHIGYTPTAGFDILPRLLQAVEKRLPGVTLTTQETTAVGLPATIAAREIDLGLAHFVDAHATVDIHTLYRVPAGILVARDHPAAGDATVAPASLADATFLIWPEEHCQTCLDALRALLAPVDAVPLTVDASGGRTWPEIRSGRTIAYAPEAAMIGAPPDITWRPLQGESDTIPVSLLISRQPLAPPLRDRVVDIAQNLASRRERQRPDPAQRLCRSS